MSPAALEFVDLRARYERVEVLHGISLTVPTSAVFAMVGPNGAGKSTLLAVAAGLLARTSGAVHVLGHNIEQLDATARARIGICLIPEGRGVFPSLTVNENLWMLTNLGPSRTEIEERAFARFPRLAERRNQIAGTMSGGEQQMLGLARALTTNPAILLLDELSMGLAPKIVAELYEEVVRTARDEQLTVVLVEQFARTVLSIADRAALIVGGRVIGVDSPAAIEEQLHVAYLGPAHSPQPNEMEPTS